MKKQMKRALAVLLCVLLAASLFGCGAKPKKQIHLFARISQLLVTQDELDIPETVKSLADLTDGKVDADMVGTWKTADGSYTYVYGEDGSASVTMAGSDSPTTAPFLSIMRQGHNILCQELKVMSFDEEGNETEGETQMAYTSYLIDGDVFYALSVEDIDEYSSSYQGSLLRFYRADADGSIDKALASEKIDLTALYGDWSGDKGSIVIDENGLTFDGETYALSVNDKQQLVAEKDGVSTAYGFGVAYIKNSTDMENTQWERKNALSLNYTGADENDKPNLLPCLTDWAAEYGWGESLYSATFTAPFNAS